VAGRPKEKKKEDGRRQRGVTNLPHWQVPQVDERDRHNRDASGVNDESDNANRGGVDQPGGERQIKKQRSDRGLL
jgi:hypothetical protein